MNTPLSKTWLTQQQLEDLPPASHVRLLAAPQVVFCKYHDGSWNELDRPGSSIASRRSDISSADLYLLGVEDDI